MKNKKSVRFFAIIIFIILTFNFMGFKRIDKTNRLKFRKDGTFKIVQFTDIHENEPINMKAISLMNNVLDNEKPDFVVLTGDITDARSMDKQKILRDISYEAAPMEKRKIYWVAVLGNHDIEKVDITRENLIKEYMKYSYNVDLSTYFNALVYSGSSPNPVFNMYFMDSGDYCSKGYGFISNEEVNWYQNTALNLKSKYKKAIPALMFFHIPLEEYKNPSPIISGTRNEDECTQEVNTGLFSKVKEMGDVKGIFVGHDHINDYVKDYQGIMLGYGRCSGYNSYSKKDYKRGARVFLVNESDPSKIKTWVRLVS